MANPRRRANRNRMFDQLISAGFDPGTAGAIANTPNWDQANSKFSSAMSNPPGRNTPPPPPTPPAMPKMETYKPPQMSAATTAALGKGVAKAEGTPQAKTLASLRIKKKKPTKVASSLGGNFAPGTGLNVQLT